MACFRVDVAVYVYWFHAGRFFNETGQIEAWLSQQSADNFVERQQCFTEQYSQFSLFGIYVSIGISSLRLLVIYDH